jgi:membrane protease YdiL (CAAX protease family)
MEFTEKYPELEADALFVTGRTRRAVEITAFVAFWMALGKIFHLSANAYLLAGIPLTLLFQSFVRRTALRSLWVRDAPPFRLGVVGVVVAVALGAFPVFELVQLFRTRLDWVIGGWLLAAVCGAIPAGYAIRNFGRATVTHFLSCLATAGVVGVLIFALAFIANRGGHVPLGNRLHNGGGSLLLYFPAVFIIEEVTFRGLLDAHLHRADEPHGIVTAIYVSILWGLWHYPIVPPGPRLMTIIPQLVTVHLLVGVPLSIFWRRSGNLAVPAFTHAFIDAVRNALMASP